MASYMDWSKIRNELGVEDFSSHMTDTVKKMLDAAYKDGYDDGFNKAGCDLVAPEDAKAMKADAYAQGYMDRDQGAMTAEEVSARITKAASNGYDRGRDEAMKQKHAGPVPVGQERVKELF